MPVFRKGYAPMQESGAHPDSSQTGCAPAVSAPTVLVVAAHALDEVLGCGGAMALHAAAGSAVHVLVLCGDGAGMDGRRRIAAGEAAALLGAQPPRFAGLPENR